MEETNRPDEREQPPIHSRGNEEEDSLGVCLMDLIPTDGLLRKLLDSEISIMKSNCLCQLFIFFIWGQWKTYCDCLCSKVHYFLQGRCLLQSQTARFLFGLSLWISHCFSFSCFRFLHHKSKNWTGEYCKVLHFQKAGALYVRGVSTECGYISFSNGQLYGQRHSRWGETESLTAVQHQGLWLMMNVLSGWIRATDSTTYNLLGRLPSVREWVRQRKVERRGERREVGKLQWREG